MAEEKKKKVDEAAEVKAAAKKEDKKAEEAKVAEKVAETKKDEVKKTEPKKEEPAAEAKKEEPKVEPKVEIKEEPKKEEPKKPDNEYSYVENIRLWQNADTYNTIPQVFSGNIRVVSEVNDEIVRVEHMLAGFGLVQSFALKADVTK